MLAVLIVPLVTGVTFLVLWRELLGDNVGVLTLSSPLWSRVSEVEAVSSEEEEEEEVAMEGCAEEDCGFLFLSEYFLFQLPRSSEG